jgi:hypothetical protein
MLASDKPTEVVIKKLIKNQENKERMLIAILQS